MATTEVDLDYPLMDNQNLQAKNSKGAQSWYGRLSDEKRAEYNQKRRTLYKEKKAAAKNTDHNEQLCQAQASASSLLCVRDGKCTSAPSESAHHQTEHMSVRCNKRTATTVPDMQTEDHNPGASLSGTVELFPTNTPVHGHGNENSNVPRSWYARLSDEKRAEYNLKRRTLYKESKAATLNTANHDQLSQPHASCLLGLHRTPFSNITNTLDDGVCTAAASATTDHQTKHVNVGCSKRTGQGLSTLRSKENKADHCDKLRTLSLPRTRMI